METVDNETVWEVERILDKRHKHGRNEYLVKWAGWSEDHPCSLVSVVCTEYTEHTSVYSHQTSVITRLHTLS